MVGLRVVGGVVAGVDHAYFRVQISPSSGAAVKWGLGRWLKSGEGELTDRFGSCGSSAEKNTRQASSPVPLFFFLMIRRPPRSTLCPNTTLFRSGRERDNHGDALH